MSSRPLRVRSRPTLRIGRTAVQRDAVEARGTASPTDSSARVLLASNRLPVTVHVENGDVRLVPSSGGLATGLQGVHARANGLWFGWPGIPAERAASAQAVVDARLQEVGAVGVPLRSDEVTAFYERFANGVLWPVLHDLPATVDRDAATAGDWQTYRRVNARFAAELAARARPGDCVWVHDYHLMLVPRLLRELRPDVRIGIFLHTPFPSLEALATLPEATSLVDGLLGADVVGFHTPEYVERFGCAVSALLGRALAENTVRDGRRAVRVRACPMSVDVGAFEELAADPDVRDTADRLRCGGWPLLLGVDRLDYTKGIPERLAAFDRLLERHPDLRGKVRLLQLAVPSREDVPAYRALRARVEALVARINGRFARPGWTPVDYVYGSVDARVLSAMYRAADVMLVTPMCDGMNLVAKEFVASRVDGDGVLVLSERAGAASELRAALLVDPSDVEQLADAFHAALTMSRTERRVRMRRLRARVQSHDVYHWARILLEDIGADAAGLELRTPRCGPARIAAPAVAARVDHRREPSAGAPLLGTHHFG